KLPYYDAVVHETLHLRPTIDDHFFPAGTVLSISICSIHRNLQVFGKDALNFNPDRWLTNARETMEKNFMSFSYDLRACIGRNVDSMMELKKTFAMLFRPFDFRLEFPVHETSVPEGFHLNCTEFPAFISKRSKV
ncbi:cytochrome P450, partial [Calycina marina]